MKNPVLRSWFLCCLFALALPLSVTAQCDEGDSFFTYNNAYVAGQPFEDVVGFEVCPTAGMAAEARIISGNLEQADPNNLKVYQGTMGSGTTGTLVFGPENGDLSGNTITGTLANECLIFVFSTLQTTLPNTPVEVCGSSVSPTSSVTLVLSGDAFCTDDAVQTLSGGTPSGGIYSGTGVIDNSNGEDFQFNPASAAGTTVISYMLGGNTATDNIVVTDANTVSMNVSLTSRCIDESSLVLPGGGMPQGGVYSGPGVTNTGDGLTFRFNPATAGIGTATITYTGPAPCFDLATDQITVDAACTCPEGQDSYFFCQDNSQSNVVAFEVCPSAGFAARATITAGTYSVFAADGDVLNVYSGASGSGTSGILVAANLTGDLSGTVIEGSVADDCLIFISTTGGFGSCQDGFETGLAACGEDIAPSVSFADPGDFCITGGVSPGLTGGLPLGGEYSGPGVTDDNNGITFSFDPSVAGAGVKTLTYTNVDAATVMIEVFNTGVVSFTAPANVCIDAGVQTGLSGGSPAGGTYNGPGVTNNGDGTYSFNPALAGLGVKTISYTDATGCMETATDNIEVLAACGCPGGETSLFSCAGNGETDLVLFEMCPTAGMFAEVTIGQGTFGSDDELTIYQGASGSGTGGAVLEGGLRGNLAGQVYTANGADNCLIFVLNSGPVSSCQDGAELPLVACGRSISGVSFVALDDISVNAGVQTGLSGGSPTGGMYSGPGVTDDANGMTYTFDPAVAGVDVHTLVYTVAGVMATDDVEVLNLTPPAFSKSFSPATIAPGSVTTLTFTIDNSASGPVTNIGFADNLPAGMTVASPAVITNTCSGGTVTATEGGGLIMFTGGSLSGNSACTISVNVTSSTPGTSTNTTDDLTSSAGNSGTTSANLTVDGAAPTFSKSFSPATVNIGEVSTLTFTIDNNVVDAVDLIGGQGFQGFTDNLPTGMVVASPANIATSCTGGVVTANPGASTITYQNGLSISPPVLAAGSSCNISVNVVPSISGSLDNVTENFTILNGSFQTVNSGKASAALTVRQPGDILIQKRFLTNPVSPGAPTALEFTITNFDRNFSATDISFTDDLTTVLTDLTATGTPITDVCGGVVSGTTMLTFSGGTLAPGGSCTFSVPLQVPPAAALGNYTSVTGPVTADINGAAVVGNTATAQLTVANVPLFTKTFLSDPAVAGGTVDMEISITNTSADFGLTDIVFTDNLDAFISGATVSSSPPGGSCGAGSTFNTISIDNELNFQMTGGNIPTSGNCTFTVSLQIPAGNPPGTYTNTTNFLTGTVNGQPVSAPPAQDDLTVLAVPRLTKSFTDDPVNAGDIVNLEFTIDYNEFATGDATNISFTDDLNAVIPGLAAVGLPSTDVCGTGSSISGTTNLTFTAGTLSPGGSCTFTIAVQVPAGIAPGSYPNTTSALTATVGGLPATGNVATDDLEIGGLDFTKEFLGNPVIPGDLTTLRFTIDNTSAFDATGISFTDDLGDVLPGLVAEAPLPVAPCGGNFQIIGTDLIFFSGGSVTAGTSCSFDVQVRVPASAVSDAYTNVTSNLSATIDGSNRTIAPATDDLVVEKTRLQLSKTFTNDPVSPGGNVTLEYTLTNLDAINTVTDIAFTDDLDAVITGLAATGLPVADVCNAGSNLSGTGLLSFTGGILAPGASCTFSVTLQVPAGATPGTLVTSTSSMVTGTINTFPVAGDPAADDLQISGLTFAKAFTGTPLPGGTATLTFTITNADPINPVRDIAFTDDLEAVIPGLVATALPVNDLCNTGSVLSGTSVINYGRGELGPGESCSFEVIVSVPCDATPGTYSNTTSELTALSNSALLTVNPATADLTVTGTAISFTSAAVTTAIACNGGTGTVTIAATGGTAPISYTFNGQTNETGVFTGVSAGAAQMYSITDANGCGPVTGNIDVTEPTAISFTSAAVTTAIACNGGTGTVTIAATGGTAPISYTFNGQTNETGVFTGVSAGAAQMYSITDANGCGPVMGTVDVTEPAAISFTSAAVTTAIACNGGTATVTIAATGGTAPISYTFNGQTNETGVFTGVSAGAAQMYSITDANSCGPVTGNIDVTEPAAISLTSAAVTTAITCNGGTGTVTIAATGGTAPISYTFNGQTNETGVFTGVSAGAAQMYSITDANSCGPVMGTVDVTEPAAITLTSAAVTTAIACNGGTATVTIAATGGTAPISYTFNGQTNETGVFTGVSAGAAQVYSITDANSCGPVMGNLDVTEPTAISFTSAAVTTAIACNGGTGTVTIAATGGTAPISYTFNGQTNETGVFTGVSAGAAQMYSITDANSCGPVMGTVDVTEPTAISFTSAAVTTAIACNGGTGTVTIAAMGGTAPLSYTFNGQTNETGVFTGVSAGATQMYSITDANSCGPVMGTVDVTEPAAITLTSAAVTTAITCNGGTGTVTIAATGGTAPISYTFNGQTNETGVFTGVSAGAAQMYSITDANSCGPVMGTVDVTEPAAITLTSAAVTTAIACNGGTGTVTIAATGGTAPISYTFNGQTNETGVFTGVSAGAAQMYSITDANSCGPVMGTVDVTEPTAISFTSAAVTTAIACNGGTGTVTIAATGGTAPISYTFNGQTNETGVFTGVSAGAAQMYSITDANSCGPVMGTVDVTEPAAITLTSAAVTTAIACNGGTGTVTIAATGGTAPISYTFNGQTNETGVFTGVSAGATQVYSITDANSCGPVMGTVDVTEPTAISFTSAAVTTAIACNGGTGTVTIVATGGTTPIFYTFNGTTNETGVFTGVSAGAAQMYSITDANSCGPVTGNIDVTEPAAISFTSAAVTTAIACNGGTATVTIAAMGGTAPLSYTFNGQTNETGVFTGVSAGTNQAYSITDANSCGPVTGNLDVTEPTAISFTSAAVTTAIACNGGTGTVTIAAMGGTAPLSYTFNGETNETGVFTSVSAGAAQVYSITDANSCGPVMGTVDVTEPAAISFTSAAVTTAIACNGGTGTVTIAATGGTAPISYTFNGQTNETGVFTGVSAGAAQMYSITDANSCGPVTGNIDVTEPAAISLTSAAVTTAIACNGGTATVTIAATGGTAPLSYTFNGETNETGVFTGVSAGTNQAYSITDANSCGPVMGTVDVTEPAAISFTSAAVTTAIACNGGTATVTLAAMGGTAPLSYTFNGETNETGVFTGVSAGTNQAYSITDANSCGPVTGNLDVTEPAAISLTSAAVTTAITCNGGTATVTIAAMGGTAPLSYTFNGQTNETGVFTGVSAGAAQMYSITDANGCGPVMGTVDVTEPAAITLTSAAVTTAIACDGGTGTVTIAATGGTSPISYTFNGQTNETGVFTGVSAGAARMYSITDANSCGPVTGNIDVTEPTAISLTSAAVTTAIACNGGTGTVTIAATGGTAPISYTFNGQTNETGVFTGVSAGAAQVYSITDANGCGPVMGTVDVTEPAAISLTSAAVTTAIACNGGTGTVTIAATGGTSPISYTFNGQTNETGVFTGVSAGAAQVYSITDANSCGPVTGNLDVTEPTAISFTSAAVTTAIVCNGGTGTVTIAAAGGTAPISYTFNGETNATGVFTGVSAGDNQAYSITDANSCGPVMGTVDVTEPAAISFTSAAVTTAIACNGGTATVTIAAMGGTAPLSYTFNGQINETGVFTSVSAGAAQMYSITDANGCGPVIGTVDVTEPAAISFTSAAVTTAIACNGGTGTVTIAATGGTSPISYTFNGTTNETGVFTGVSAGAAQMYSITDANGCGPVMGNIDITEPAAISLTSAAVTTAIACNGGTATVTLAAMGGTPPLSYTFNGQTNETGVFTGVSAGDNQAYSITDANSCGPVMGTVDVTEPAAISFTSAAVTTVIACNGGTGTVTIAATGGTSPISYTFNGQTNETGVFTGVSAGAAQMYSITDANGCGPVIGTVDVTEPAAISFTSAAVTTAIACNGGTGTVTIAATGGTSPISYTFNGTTNETGVFTGVSAGAAQMYSITDANGCGPVMGTVDITEPAAISFTSAAVTTAIACNGGTGTVTIAATGGTSPISYTFNGTTNETGVFTGVSAGAAQMYSITDANSCGPVTGDLDVTEPTTISLTSAAVTTAIACNGGTATVTLAAMGGTPPLSYTFNGQTNETGVFTGVSAGDNQAYSITDANSCGPVMGTVDVTEPAAISFTSAAVTTVIACNGGTGTVTIAATGGTSPISYTFNGQTNETGVFTGVSAGAAQMYSITDANGCGPVMGTVDVTEPAAISLTSAAVTTAIACNGGTATVTLAAMGGTGPLSYTFNGETNETGVFTGVSAGTNQAYSITDANSCGPVTSNLDVTEPTAISLTSAAVTTAIACNGGTGTVTIAATGGTAPLSYTFNGQTNETGVFTGVSAGAAQMYSITDANSCGPVTGNIDVTEPAAISFTSAAVTTAIACNGGTGTVTIAATGGTAPISYTFNGQTNETGVFTGVSAGAAQMYSITDANGCGPVMGNLDVTEPTAISFTSAAVTTAIACNGGTGTVTIAATGGTSPISYTFNGQTNETGVFTGVSAGAAQMYSITDANSCGPVMGTVDVTEPAAISFTSAAVTTAIACNGGTGTVTIAATGGTAPISYTFNGQTNETGVFTGVSAGAAQMYSITDANSCGPVMGTVDVTEPAAITLTSAAVTTAIACNGGTGTVTIAATGGTAPLSYTFNGETNETGVFTGVSAGAAQMYSITDANSCGPVTGNIDVTEPTAISFTSAAVTTAIVCNGGTGTVTIAATGGTAPISYTFNGQTNETGVFTGVSAGAAQMYSITDANSCGPVMGTVDVTEPTAISFTSAAVTTAIVCNGGTGTVTIAATGGTAPISYTFNGQTNETGVFTGVSAGAAQMYSITDANSCGPVMGTVDVTEPTAISFTSAAVTTAIACNGGTATVTIAAMDGTAPLSYTFNGQTNETGVFTGVSAGTNQAYSITDANSCGPVTGNIDVTEPPAISLTSAAVTTAITCNGGTGTVTIAATGGTAPISYTFNGTTNETGVFTGVSAGAAQMYSITDANSCGPVTGNLDVTEPAAISLTSAAVTTAIACNGGTATVTLAAMGGTAPLSYTFNGQTNETGVFTGVSAGDNQAYSITDANSCGPVTGNIDVTEPTAISFTSAAVTTAIACNGGTATVTLAATGGTAPISYTFNGQTNETGVFTGVSAGDNQAYSITDANSCGPVTGDLDVTEPTAISFTSAAVTTAITCNGGTGTVTIAATGGTAPISYTFNGTTNETGVFTGVSAGAAQAYSITDANSCGPVTGNIDVTEPPAISLTSAAVTTAIACNGGTATVTIAAMGGTAPLSYTFNGETNETGVFTGVSAGDDQAYSITDANSCGPVTGNIDVTEPAAISLTSAAVTTAIACNGGTGTVTIAAMGGTAPLSYTFNGQTNTTGVFTGVSAGDNQAYSITDANSCGPVTGTVEVTVTDVTAPTLTNCQPVSVDLDANGMATLTLADLTFTADDNCAVTDTRATPLAFDCNTPANQMITITVEDAAGLTAECMVTVTVNDVTAPTLTDCQPVSVDLDANGMATLTLADLTFTADDNCIVTDTTATPLTFDCDTPADQMITIMLTDASGGTTSCMISVTVLDDTPPTVMANDTTLYLDENGLAELAVEDFEFSVSDNCEVTITDIFRFEHVASNNLVGGAAGARNVERAKSLDQLLEFDCADVGNPNLCVEIIAMDDSGNETRDTIFVRVLDTIPPTAVCMDITIQLDADGSASISTDGTATSQIDGGSSDNCSFELSTDIASFDCSDLGDNVVTLTATDGSGAESFCTAIVTVEPSEACLDPEILDPTGYFYCTSDGSIIPGGSVTITDANGVERALALDGSNGFYQFFANDPGTYTLTFTLPPNTFLDPDFVDSGEIVALPDGADLTIGSDDADNDGFLDDFTVASNTFYSQFTFNASTDGDIFLNNIPVLCKSEANLSCIGSVNLSLDEACSGEIVPEMVLTGDFDGVGATAFVITVMDGNTANGPIVDGCGSFNYSVSIAPGFEGLFSNFETCWGVVNAEDKTPPAVVTTPDDVDLLCVDLDGNNLATLPVSTSRCYRVNAQTGATIPGTMAAALRARLLAGGLTPLVPTFTDGCSQEIEVCVFDVVAFGADPDCDDVVITRTFVASEISTCVAAAGEGNPSVSTAYVLTFGRPTLDDLDGDNIDDVVNIERCGSDPSVHPVPRAGDYPFLVVGDRTFNLQDGQSVCNIGVTYSDGPSVVTCPNTYKFIRTYTVIDWCTPGDTRTFTQVVKVGDTTAPTFIGPNVPTDANGTLVYGTNAGNICAAFIRLDDVSVTDNCPGAVSISAQIYPNRDLTGAPIGAFNVVPGGSPELTPAIPAGTHTLRYTYTDVCGNTGTTDFDFRVEDQTPPVAVCEDGLNISVAGGANNGFAVLTAANIDAGSYDDCSAVTLAIARVNGNDEAIGGYAPQITLTCADLGTVRVGLRVTDALGNENFCWLDVLVEDKLAPSCVAPANTTITCVDYNATLPNDIADASFAQLDDLFGQAAGVDNCGTTITQTVSGTINSCGVGRITRRFTSTDDAGFTNTNLCVQNITVIGIHDYRITFPTDEEGDCMEIPAYDGVVAEEIACDLITTTFDVDTLRTQLAGDECFKLRVTYDVVNWCEYNSLGEPYIVQRDAPGARDRTRNPRDIDEDLLYVNVIPGLTTATTGDDVAFYTLIETDRTFDPEPSPQRDQEYVGYAVNANNSRGFWRYTQFIKIYDEVAPEITFTEPAECFAGSGEGCRTTVTLEFTATDECSRAVAATALDANFTGIFSADNPAALGVGVNLDNDGEGNYTITATNVPVGAHAIRVSASDGCGNFDVQIIEFCVTADRTPTPICIQTLTVTLMNAPPAPNGGDNGGGIAAIWAADFIASPIEDCFGNVVDKYSIYRSSAAGAAGFTPVAGIIGINDIDCDDFDNGTVSVRVYAFDDNGSAPDFCEVVVEVQDNMGHCDGSTGNLSGLIATQNDEVLEGVRVSLTSSDGMDETAMTSANGTYNFTGLPLNADYTVQPVFDAAFNAQNVRASDLVAGIRQILGTVPFTGAYQFVAADVNQDGSFDVFDILAGQRAILGLDDGFAGGNWFMVDAGSVIDMNDPYAAAFPEVFNANDLAGSVTADFVAVEKMNLTGATGRVAQTLNVDDAQLESGQSRTILLDGTHTAGFQGTIELAAGLELISADLTGQGGLNLNRVGEGLIAVLLREGGAVRLEVRATTSGLVSELITLSDAITVREGVALNGTSNALDLAFNADFAPAAAHNVLHQNIPNPVADVTTIAFTLAQAGEARLTIRDIAGRVISVREVAGAAGRNQVELSTEELGGATGVLSYTLVTGNFSATKKMVVVR